MRLEGTYTFPAPRAAVWDALMDPAVLAGALPGGEALERVGENDYRAVMAVKVGPVQGKFEGKIVLADVVAPERYTMKVDGQGAPGFVAGEGTLELVEANGGTLLRYGGDLQVGGRIANVGQRLIESTAKSVTRQGLTALDQTIQARISPPVTLPPPARTDTLAGAAATPAPRPAAAQPSMAGVTAEVIKDVAKDLASDYIPADKQTRVLYFGLGALTMLLFVVLVRLVQRN